ncbi:Heparinase II/III-like protein [Opitutaceae bacterium TAV1]|nr:Heparinase II/III-like protein [Opitutaceae bacterium TAV1]
MTIIRTITALIALLLASRPDLTHASTTAATTTTAATDSALPAFPKPTPETWCAETKLLQPDGSVFRAAREDWTTARRLATGPDADPAWAAWLKKQRAAADDWMARHRDRVEWAGGREHAFVSPRDGSFLTWTAAIPGEETDHLSSPSDPHVAITPIIFGAWVAKFRQTHIRTMRDAARLYRITGDTRYADWAAGQLDFYAANLHRWPTVNLSREPAGPRLAYESLGDAVLLSDFVETARLLFDITPPARRQAWFDGLFKPEVELLDKTWHNRIQNHAVWHRASAAQVALLYNDDAMWRREMDGPYGLRAQLQRGVTSDYFWLEQSIGYNNYVIIAIQPLLTFAGLLGKADLLRDEAAIIQNLAIAPLTIRFPDGTFPNPADSGSPARIAKVIAKTLAGLYRILPTRSGLAAATLPDNRTWDTLLDPPAAVRGEYAGRLPPASSAIPAPLVVSRSLESTRFALLKDGPWQVFFHYGQIDSPHMQDEALNWSASFEGVDVTHDPGTVGYGSKLTGDYYRRGLNHNVPLINGEGQKPWHPGKLLAFDPAPGRAAVSAIQPQYRPDAAARRTLRIEGNRLVDEATITLASKVDPARLGLALHLQGTPQLPGNFAPVSSKNFASGRPVAFGYWRDVRAATFENETTFDVTLAKNKTLRVRFALAGGGRFTVYQGSSPDYPPARRAGFYIEKEQPAKTATFVTTLSPESPEN